MRFPSGGGGNRTEVTAQCGSRPGEAGTARSFDALGELVDECADGVTAVSDRKRESVRTTSVGVIRQGGGVAKRTAADTRRELINAGLQMLFERGAAVGVQHIRLQDVLRRVGLTTGAAYRIWADQTDYQRDLAVAAVKLRISAPSAEATAVVEQLIAAGVTPDELIRLVAIGQMELLERYRTHPVTPEAEVFVTVLALRMNAATWPELAAASKWRHDESVAEFAVLYQRVMDDMGYRMRAPYTVELFAEAMTAVTEGFAVRAAEGLDLLSVSIPDGAEGPAGEWTLYGLMVRALVAEFTIPNR